MPTSNSVKRIEQPQFRRKSDRQVDRDARRSQEWRSKSYAATPADHPGQLDTIQGDIMPFCNDLENDSNVDNPTSPVHGVLTRSKARQGSTDVEVLRCDMGSHSLIEMPILEVSALDPEAEPFVGVLPDTSLIQDSDDVSSHTEVTSPGAASQYAIDSTSDSTVSSDNGDDDVSDDGSTASGVVVTGCQNKCCAYGSGIHNVDSIMVCTKCTNSRSTLCICTTCLAEGGHAKHRKYLKCRIPAT